MPVFDNPKLFDRAIQSVIKSNEYLSKIDNIPVQS